MGRINSSESPAVGLWITSWSCEFGRGAHMLPNASLTSCKNSACPAEIVYNITCMFYVTQLLTLSALHTQLCSILVLTKLYYPYDYLSSRFIYHLVFWKECKVLENETICALRWNGGQPCQALITAPSIRAVSSCYPTLTSGDRNISSVQSVFFLKYQEWMRSRKQAIQICMFIFLHINTKITYVT